MLQEKKMSKRLYQLIPCLALLFLSACSPEKQDLPLIAIANYGPHSSLFETIEGFKQHLATLGFQEGATLRYTYADAQFDPTTIIPMLSGLKAKQPTLCLAITTPVAQSAKTIFKGQNLVFAAITDPVAAGLLKDLYHPDFFITGASEQQDIDALLNFCRTLLPNAHRLGLLYATGEANDLALLAQMEAQSKHHGFQLVAQGIDHPRDVPLRMATFKNKIDVLYVGTSGPIQPSLPVIIAEANKLNIPIINADQDAVKKHQVLASFGVSYARIGMNAGSLAARILKGEKAEDLKPIHPKAEDHQGLISKKMAEKLGINFHPNQNNIAFVE